MRPATADDKDKTELRHQSCGGSVQRMWHYWVCDNCTKRWSLIAMRKWDSQDMGDRFYVLPERDPRDLILVEKQEGKTRFTCLVSREEAGNYERAKL